MNLKIGTQLEMVNGGQPLIRGVIIKERILLDKRKQYTIYWRRAQDSWEDEYSEGDLRKPIDMGFIKIILPKYIRKWEEKLNDRT